MNYFKIIFWVTLIVSSSVLLTDDMDSALIMMAISSLVYFGVSTFIAYKKKQNLLADDVSYEGIDEEKAELLAANLKKAIDDFKYLESMKDKLNDKDMNNHLQRMQRTARNLIVHLGKHPERIPSAFKFIDYYQDRAVKIVNQYNDLESTELTTDKVRELKERMKSTFAALDSAYAEQFEKVLNEQILSVDAELKVMEQQFDAEGIKRPDTTSSIDFDKVDTYDDFSDIDDSNYNPFKKQLGRKNRPKYGQPIQNLSQLKIIPDEQRGMVIQRKLIQSALAIFFGGFGAHKFYQGKNFSGFIRLFLSMTLVPMPLMFFIGFCEGIRYLFMSMDDFYLQYIDDDKK